MDDMNRTTAKVARTLSIAVLALSGIARAQTPPAQALDLQSDQKLGYVTLNSDLVLDDGRLVLAVGAFNKSAKAAALSPANISIATTTGKPVPLVPFARLEQETRARYLPKQGATMHAPTSRAIDTTAADESGGGHTGNESLGSRSIGKPRAKPDPEAEKRMAEALENLRVAILQDMTIEPRAAGSGQLVTQTLKFARGEPRKLKMSVTFAGELHEFEFEVPAK
jgi:hypothetical protein